MTLSETQRHAGQLPAPDTTGVDKFPEGLRVLAVDDNSVCLRVLEAFLLRCRYKVTVTTKAVHALNLLRENENSFDIVITDVHMLEMDGFRLLEIIGLEMDIPVIMMSSNEDKETVMKGIEHGACDYLLKPIRLEVLKNIWQHVFRKIKVDTNDSSIASRAVTRSFRQKRRSRNNNQRRERELKENDDDDDDLHSNSTQKRARVAWNPMLHKKFMSAFYKLGSDKAIPSKILKEMKEPGLTREKVASHLQKYRNALKKNGSQESYTNIGSKLNENLSMATAFPFNSQGSNAVNYLNGFRANRQCSSRMSPFGNYLQKPVAYGYGDVYSKSHLLPQSQQNILLPRSRQNILLQQLPQNSQVGHQTYNRIQGITPRELRTESLASQTYLNRIHSQPFSSTTNICNGSTETSLTPSCYDASNENGLSSFPSFEIPSDFLPISNSLHLAGDSIHDDIFFGTTNPTLQHDSEIITVEDVLAGQHEGEERLHMDTRSSNEEQSTGIAEIPQMDNIFEDIEIDSNYHFSSSSSIDDDLHAAIKQFNK